MSLQGPSLGTPAAALALGWAHPRPGSASGVHQDAFLRVALALLLALALFKQETKFWPRGLQRRVFSFCCCCASLEVPVTDVPEVPWQLHRCSASLLGVGTFALAGACTEGLGRRSLWSPSEKGCQQEIW